MSDIDSADKKAAPPLRGFALGLAIVFLTLFGYFQCTSTYSRVYLHIFPNGFTGPTKILLDPNAPPLPRSQGAKTLMYGDGGVIRVNEDDFEDLAHWAEHKYRYADGRTINLYVPHTGLVTEGPWIELLPREGMIVNGRDVAEQALKAQIGTVSRG